MGDDGSREEPVAAYSAVDGSTLQECRRCGAAVANQVSHTRWHRAKIGRDVAAANTRNARKT